MIKEENKWDDQVTTTGYALKLDKRTFLSRLSSLVLST
jgi:hypothetical protein